MEFSEVVRRRRMVRNYDPDRAVSEEVRERILENGLRAPSGGFTQGWAFLTLEGDDRERYWRIAAENADEKYVGWLTGLRRAVLLMLQTVVDEGLGACFFGPPADKASRLLEEFGVPEGFDLIGLLSVGYR